MKNVQKKVAAPVQGKGVMRSRGAAVQNGVEPQFFSEIWDGIKKYGPTVAKALLA